MQSSIKFILYMGLEQSKSTYDDTYLPLVH
jgi:hypothetical protein